MKFPRILLLLAAPLFLAACQTPMVVTHRWPTHYHRVRVTNPRGDLIADWIAEGFVARTELGYRFHAVERVSAPPFVQVNHYPRGRRVEVGGPNIVVSRAGVPLWLYELRGY